MYFKKYFILLLVHLIVNPPILYCEESINYAQTQIYYNPVCQGIPISTLSYLPNICINGSNAPNDNSNIFYCNGTEVINMVCEDDNCSVSCTKHIAVPCSDNDVGPQQSIGFLCTSIPSSQSILISYMETCSSPSLMIVSILATGICFEGFSYTCSESTIIQTNCKTLFQTNYSTGCHNTGYCNNLFDLEPTLPFCQIKCLS